MITTPSSTTRTGFSLIELLLVIVIIGMLGAIAIPRIDVAYFQVNSAVQAMSTTMVAAQREGRLGSRAKVHLNLMQVTERNGGNGNRIAVQLLAVVPPHFAAVCSVGWAWFALEVPASQQLDVPAPGGTLSAV